MVDGELAVHLGGEGRVALGTRTVGAWLGEVGFIDGGPATATVEAQGPARVLRIHRDELDALAAEKPEVAAVLLREVTRQLAERISRSSSGIVERLGDGHLRVRKPEEVRGWVSTMLSRLVGEEVQ